MYTKASKQPFERPLKPRYRPLHSVVVISSPDPDWQPGDWFPATHFFDSLNRHVWPTGMVVSNCGEVCRVEGRRLVACMAPEEAGRD